MEELVLDLFHENKILKDRLTEIEKELGIQKVDSPLRKNNSSLVQNQVIKLYTHGRTENEIAELLNLSLIDVEKIIQSFIAKDIK